MSVASFEGIVENGKVKLLENVSIPERTKVYVVIPGASEPSRLKIRSPRLVDPQQAPDFKKTVFPDAKL